MKYIHTKIVLICWCLFCSLSVFAQSELSGCPDSECCLKRLKEAQENFEEGNLEQVRRLLQKFQRCRSFGLSTDKVNEGYEMLITSLIYMNSDTTAAQQAEFRMVEFLRYNPTYVPDSTKADFYHLYQQYRTHPILILGASAGLGTTQIHVKQEYSSANTSEGAAHPYSRFSANYRLALTIGIPIGQSPFELGIEPSYFTRSYGYEQQLVTSLFPDNTPFSTLSFKENHGRLGLALLGRYYLPLKEEDREELGFNKNSRKPMFYVYGGIEPSYLMWAEMENVVRRLSEQTGENEGAVQDDRLLLLPNTKQESANVPMRVRGHTSLLAGGGITKNIGEYRLGFDFRIGWMLGNQVMRKNRYAHSELLYIYGHVDDDFSMSNINLSISLQKRIFNPVPKDRETRRNRERNQVKKEMVRRYNEEAKEIKEAEKERVKAEDLQKRKEALEQRKKELEERKKELEELIKDKKSKPKKDGKKGE